MLGRNFLALWAFFLNVLLAQEAASSDEDTDESPSNILLRNTKLIELGGSIASLKYGDIMGHCKVGVESVGLLFEKSETNLNFELLTSLRYRKDFDLISYTTHSYAEDLRLLSLSSSLSSPNLFDFEILPGPTTILPMANNIRGPVLDYVTHVKPKSATVNNFAAIISCKGHDVDDRRLLKQFSHAYFAEIPFKDKIEGNGAYKIDGNKFLSAGFYSERDVHLSRASVSMLPGFSYQCWLDQLSGVAEPLFRPILRVEFPGLTDGPQYPEEEPSGWFRITVPHWPKVFDSDLSPGTAHLTIYHDPNTSYSPSLSIWWSLTAALMARRNMDLCVWLFIAFLLSRKLALSAVCGVAAVTRIKLFQGNNQSLAETLIVTAIVFSLAKSANLILSTIIVFSKLGMKDEGKPRPNNLRLALIPLFTMGACIFYKLWGIIPVIMAMELITIRTLQAKGAPADVLASHILLQFLAFSGYLAPQLPHIVNAINYHVPIPMAIDTESVSIWVLIVWSLLVKSKKRKASMDALRQTVTFGLLIGLLPKLELSSIWAGYNVQLAINLASSLV